MNWPAVENAIRAAIKSASGLDDGHLIWSDQNGPRPEGLFISLKLDGPFRVGRDWIDIAQLTPSPIGTITYQSRGLREVNISLQCFDGDATGTTSSRGLLSTVQSKLHLPSIREVLNNAGVSIIDYGTIRNIPAILNSDFESRATLELRLYIAEEVTETGITIESVEVTNLDTSQVFVIDSND